MKLKGEALDPKTCHLATVQLATRDQRCLIFVMEDPQVREACRQFLLELQRLRPVWILHNAKFDYHQLRYHLDIHFDDQLTHDTCVCEVLIKGARDYDRVNLAEVTTRYPLPDGLQKIDCASRISDWWSGMTEEQIAYASMDVFVLHPLMDLQKEQMRKDRLLQTRKLECNLIPRIVRLEEVGIAVDKEKLYEFSRRAKERIKEEVEVYASVFGDINFNSPTQVLQRIKDHYGVVPTKSQYNKKLGVFEVIESADKFALLEAGIHQDPAIEAYLAIKEISAKVKEADRWHELEDGYIRVKFNQVPMWGSDDGEDGGARTGRISTSPQLQNIANFMKQFMVSPKGWRIGSSDYASIELRIMASVANDAVMKQAFQDGTNLHKAMAVRAFSMDPASVDKKGREYRVAKEINFGFPYGMSGPKFCSRVLKASNGDIRLTDEQGWAFRQTFFKTYTGVAKYQARQLASGCLNGYVTTPGGRRRYYNNADRPKLDNQVRPFFCPWLNLWIGYQPGWNEIKFGERVTKRVWADVVDYNACWRAADYRWKNICYNMPIQGGCADGAKEAVASTIDAFESKLNGRASLFAMVHDSLDFIYREDVHDDVFTLVATIMVNSMQHHIPDVPVAAEHSSGRCWASPPKNIETDDRGLWFRPAGLTGPSLDDWVRKEFQQDVEVILHESAVA